MTALADIARRLDNLIRFGKITDVDHDTARCRVLTGKNETAWLSFNAARAGNTRTWDPPTVGEQVVIFSPSGELAAGIVMPAIYTIDHDQPSTSPDEHVTDYPDGARIAYNHATGALTAAGIKTATVEAAVKVTLDTPLTHITGKLTVDDLLTYGNGLAGTGGGNGNTISGPLTQTGGDLSSNGIVVHAHTHTGVQPGGGSTGGPQ